MEYEQEMREYRSADEKFTANRFDVTPIAVLPVVPKKESFYPDRTISQNALFNTNKNPKLCSRKKISFETVEKKMRAQSDYEYSDNYYNYMIDSVTNPDGFKGINKGPLQKPDMDYEIEEERHLWLDGNKSKFFSISRSRHDRNKQVAQVFSRSSRKYDTEDAFLDDSFDSDVRTFDARNKQYERQYQQEEESHITLEDRFDIVTESAFDQYDIRNI